MFPGQQARCPPELHPPGTASVLGQAKGPPGPWVGLCPDQRPWAPAPRPWRRVHGASCRFMRGHGGTNGQGPAVGPPGPGAPCQGRGPVPGAAAPQQLILALAGPAPCGPLVPPRPMPPPPAAPRGQGPPPASTCLSCTQWSCACKQPAAAVLLASLCQRRNFFTADFIVCQYLLAVCQCTAYVIFSHSFSILS